MRYVLMKHTISRRGALTSGAAMTGLMLGANAKTSQAWTLPDVGGADFLSQWSPPANVKRNLTPGSSEIRISCVDNGISNSRGSAAEQVAKLREAGFTAAEGMSTGLKLMTDSELREFQAALKQHDVMFYNIHVWANITHPDQARREAVHKEYLRAIEMAEQFGITFILVHTGGRGNNPDVPHPENWTMETWKMSVDALKKVISDSPGSKINLAIEAINANNTNTPTSHVRLKQDVGSERIKVALDPTNMMHPGVCFRASELINTCFELLGEDIMYAHAKDVQWRSMLPGLSWVNPGQGTMDYELYLAQLSRLKYPRALMIEFLNNADRNQQARQYIEETAAKIGVKIHK
jgi:sugar phosphate isomerase/epimerase